jgi:triosephosphate isomerase
MARDQIIVGNWKMYKTAREASAYLEDLIPLIEGSISKVFLAVPYTSITSAAKAAKGTEVTVGAQNMNDAREGAFTGEIAALMLKEAGAEFVLLGHSERRTVFGETNEFIQRKVVRALQDDLIPVLCVGEALEEREGNQTEASLRKQILECLEGVPKEEAAKLILAYEPLWAIGTGKTATAELAQAAHVFCRQCLTELFGKKIGELIPILYGGSVNARNAEELIVQDDIDGVLVGGASLNSETFAQIAMSGSKKMAPKKKTTKTATKTNASTGTDVAPEKKKKTTKQKPKKVAE